MSQEPWNGIQEKNREQNTPGVKAFVPGASPTVPPRRCSPWVVLLTGLWHWIIWLFKTMFWEISLKLLSHIWVCDAASRWLEWGQPWGFSCRCVTSAFLEEFVLKPLTQVSVPWFSTRKNKAMIQALDSELAELEIDDFLFLCVYFVSNGIYTGILG